MQFRLVLLIVLLGAFGPRSLHAQHAFDDLPVDDPSKRSVLAPGESPEKKVRENMFIVANLSHYECYPGQQILLSYRLYTSLQSTSTVTTKPILNGFTIKERRSDETPLPDKTVDGRRYHGFLVWQALLTPLQPGEYTIDPLKTSNVVSYTTADGRTAHYEAPLASRKTTVYVRPLPAIDRPPSFTGLVGKWQIQSRLTAPRTDSSGNDTLLVEITGSGSFDNITLPYMRWPAGFRHLEPIQQWEINDTANPQSGRTTFAIPFTAPKPGEYSLSPMELAWFDPATEKYFTKATDSLIVHVLTAPAPLPASPVVTPPKTTPAPQTSSPILLLLVALIVVMGILFLVIRRRKPAPKIHIAEPPTANNPAPPRVIDSPADVKQSLIHFLQQHLQTDAWAEEDILQLLQQKDPSLAGKVTNLINECNELLYSPHLRDRRTMTRLIRQLDAIVKKA